MIGFKILTEEPAKIERYIFNIVKLVIVTTISLSLTKVEINLLNLTESLTILTPVDILLTLVVGVVVWFFVWEFIAKSIIEIIIFIFFKSWYWITLKIKKKKGLDIETIKFRKEEKVLDALLFIDGAPLNMGIIDMLNDILDEEEGIYELRTKYNQYFFTLTILLVFLSFFESSLNSLFWFKLILWYLIINFTLPGVLVEFIFEIKNSPGFLIHMRNIRQAFLLNEIEELEGVSKFLSNYDIKPGDIKFNRKVLRKKDVPETFPESIRINVIGVRDDFDGNRRLRNVLESIGNEDGYTVILSNIESSETNSKSIVDKNCGFIYGDSQEDFLKGLEIINEIFNDKYFQKYGHAHDFDELLEVSLDSNQIG